MSYPTGETKEKSIGQRLDVLLIMRGLLAMSVVIWHFVFARENHPAWISIPGRTAVWIFYGISGYVISYGFFTKRYLLSTVDIKRFYINRFLRIYPLFFLLSVLSFVTAYSVNGKSPLSLQDIPSELLMLQFNHNYILNSVFWTLGVEIQYYLLVPLFIVFFLYRFSHPFIWYAGMYLLFLGWLPAAHYLFGQSFDGRNLISNLTHFISGMIACKFVLENRLFKVNQYLLTGTIVAILICTNYLYRHEIKIYWSLGSLLIDMLIFLSVILHYSLSSKIIYKQDWVVRSLAFLGVISYGIYAWHPYLGDYFPVIHNNILIAVAATVLIATISYYLFEKPIQDLKRKQQNAGKTS